MASSRTQRSLSASERLPSGASLRTPTRPERTERLERMADGQLVTLALNGERRAFPLLMTRYEPKLQGLVGRRVRNSEDAADIVQDTLMSAWAALQTWPATHPFETWLICIALNKCRDWGRRRTVRIKAAGYLVDFEPEAGLAADVMLIRDQDLAALQTAFADLPAALREPLALTAFDELPQRDAADRLGVSVKAVETRVRRARIALRESLVH